MITKSLREEEESNLFSLMNEKGLRKVVSDVSAEINKYGNDLEAIAKIDEVQQAECECCGLTEYCTPDYILQVKDSYSGKWVCGLCSEAVKERLMRAAKISMENAVNSHRNFCQEFNTTTRLNPKLSLTIAMRDIAKRSCANRNSKNSSMSKIARSTSCVPRIDPNTK
ncbi:hypothetical protein L1049_018524 [Liquidambar formosana]|uniref:DUF1677 family protein n=1 Tax=Liquidambar formosana TaxID=63359 RepID=A0AAP0WMC9_LIQFO